MSLNESTSWFIKKAITTFIPSLDQTISIALYGLPLATQISLLHQIIKVSTYTLKQGVEIAGAIKRNVSSTQKIKCYSVQEDTEEECVIIENY